MARKTTDTDREKMFLAWQEKQTVNYVQVKCGFHNATVKKYRTLDKWDERLKKITVKVTRKVNTGLSTLKAEQLLAGTTMREMGVNKLNSIEPEDIDARLAKDLIKDGIGIERDAVGDTPPDTLIIMALPPGLEKL